MITLEHLSAVMMSWHLLFSCAIFCLPSAFMEMVLCYMMALVLKDVCRSAEMSIDGTELGVLSREL